MPLRKILLSSRKEEQNTGITKGIQLGWDFLFIMYNEVNILQCIRQCMDTSVSEGLVTYRECSKEGTHTELLVACQLSSQV